MNDEFVSIEHLMLFLLQKSKVAQILKDQGVTERVETIDELRRRKSNLRLCQKHTIP
jgi:hypothetical protein